MRRNECRLTLILAITAVALMMVQTSAIGFASVTSEKAVTINTGNNASADYFTAGLYTYSGPAADKDYVMDFNRSNFTVVSTAAFNMGDVPYTHEGSTYTVNNGITNAAINDLYIAVDSRNNHSMIGSTFTLSYEVTGITEASFTGNATLVWGGGTPAIEPDKAYRLHLSLSGLNYSSDTAPSMTITVAITITDGNRACYASAGNSVTFRIATPIDEFKEELDNTNEDLEEQGMEFYADDSNPAGVYIQNSTSETHSIAASDTGHSEIDVNISVPSGVYFCIYVTIKGALTIFSDRSDVTVAIKKVNASTGATITNYGSVPLEPNWYGNDVNKYVYIGNNNKVTSGNNKPTNNSQFFHCSPGEEISISFSGDQGTNLLGRTMTVTAKLIMK